MHSSSERTGKDFSAVSISHTSLARVFSVFSSEARDEFFRFLQSVEGTSSLVTLSPTLVDPALVSVIRAVDGQDTGLSAQPAEQSTSDRHRPGLSSSERTGPGFCAFKASADRPAQKKATSDVISSQPIACPFYQITKLVTCFHRPGRSEVRSSELTSTVIPVAALQTQPCCQ